ncbi:MAG: 50S ribosomal protein L3 N(5)-glutamine methyltransferase [Burkholderiaceae bacterium]
MSKADPIDSDASSRLRSVRDLLRYAVSRFSERGLFFGHGSDNAWDEAVYLVLHSLHLPLTDLDPYLDARLTRAEVRGVLQLIQQRSEGIPAAYLTGEAWLGEYRFKVDARVIVPRSFIAELLFETLTPWIANPLSVKKVLDLCTGSGCLAIIAADVFPNAQVDAVDISAEALEVARENVTRYGLQTRVRLIQSDLFEQLGKARYDLIICNPPYVSDGAMLGLPAEYRHEPRLALAGGHDGLDVVDRILADAPRHLARARGYLVMEIGHERPGFERRYPGFSGTWLATGAGADPVLLATAAELQKLEHP